MDVKYIFIQFLTPFSFFYLSPNIGKKVLNIKKNLRTSFETLLLIASPFNGGRPTSGLILRNSYHVWILNLRRMLWSFPMRIYLVVTHSVFLLINFIKLSISRGLKDVPFSLANTSKITDTGLGSLYTRRLRIASNTSEMAII